MLLWRSLSGKNIIAALSQKGAQQLPPKAAPKPEKQAAR